MDTTENLMKVEKKDLQHVIQVKDATKETLRHQDMQMNMSVTKQESSILDEIKAIPKQCCELNQELKESAAAESSKLGRSAIEEKQMEKRTNLLRKRDQLRKEHMSFFAPGQQYSKKLTDAFRVEKNMNAGTIAAHMTSSVEAIKLDKLLISDEAKTAQFLALSNLMQQLQDTDATKITKDQVQTIKEAYDALQLKQAPVGMKYLDEELLDRAYLVLYHTVAMALFQTVNVMPREHVNLEELSKLYGVATASSVAMGTAFSEVVQQNTKQKERKEQATILNQEVAVEQERSATQELEAKKRYIYNGIGENGKAPAEWPMADYAEAAIRLIGEENLKQLSMEELARRLQRMQDMLISNIRLIANLSQKAGDIYQLSNMQELLREKVKTVVSDRLIAEQLDEVTVQTYIDDAKALLGEAERVYKEYQSYLTTDEIFSQIPNVFQNELLKTYMNGDSLELFKERVAQLRGQVEANLKIAEKHMANALIEVLREPAKKEFLKRYGDILLAGSVREIAMKTDWYLTYICEYAPEIFDEASGLNATEYLLYAKPVELTDVSRYLFSEHLKNQDLCKWPGFEDAFVGYEKELLECIGNALKDEVFGEAYLRDIHSIGDIDLLQYNDYQTFLTMMRANLGAVLENWSMIKCPMEREIRTALLHRMVRGTLTEANFFEELQKELVADAVRQERYKQRRNVLFANKTGTSREIQCRYLDVTANTAFHAEPRNMARTRRFQNAASVRAMMRDFDIEYAFEREVLSLATNGEVTAKAVISIVEKLTDKLSKEEQKELMSLFKADDGCAIELVVSGYEDLILQQKDIRYSFAGEKRELYQQKLEAQAKTLVLRKEKLNKACASSRLKDNVREALVGMEELVQGQEREQKKRNLERFGVESLDVLMNELTLYEHNQKNMRKEVAETKKRYEQRYKLLSRMRGGMYRPLMDQMVKNSEIFESMMLQPDISFEKFMETLDQRLIIPMKLIGRSYGAESAFAKQIYLEYGNAIIQGHEPEIGWSNTFYYYYKAISDHKVGDISITDNFGKIINEQTDIAPYLISILLEQIEGSMLLADEKSLDALLEPYRVRIKENEETLRKACGDEFPILSKYLLKPIASEDAAQFQANLQERLDGYRMQQELTKEDTARARAVLGEKKTVLLQIEIKKHKGKEKDIKDRRILHTMKHGRELLTPVLMTYQKENASLPSLGQIDYAQKRLQELLEEETQIPQLVKDLLAERILAESAPIQDETLRSEAQRLTQMYEKVTSEAFEKTHVKMTPIMQESFLTYLYCKEKGNAKSGNDLDAEIENGYASFASVHKILLDLRKLEVTQPLASKEKDELMKAAQTAFYSMSADELKEFVERRSAFIIRMNELEPVCEQLAKETYQDSVRQKALKLGLLAYYREELTGAEELSADAMRVQMKELVSDADACLYLSQTKAQLFEETGSEVLTADEQQTDTFMTRESFEKLLGSMLDQRDKDAYNKLSLQQRKIWALALSVPGMHTNVSGLSGQKLFHAGEDDAGMLASIQAQVQSYIQHEEFHPQIDYNTVYERLQFGPWHYNMEAFRQAITFTQMVETSRQEQYEPDYTRLTDSVAIIEAAKRVGPDSSQAKRQNVSEAIPTVETFFEHLQASDEGEKTNLKKRLGDVTKSEIAKWRLIQVLQDRTVLDYSTTVGFFARAKGTVTPFVNEGKRMAMLERAQKGTDLGVDAPSSKRLERAMNTLLSYQLRNDICMDHRELRQDDFASGALKRKTVVDWELLERALDFVEEMNRAQMRQNAIQQAPKLILQGKNEKAKAEYQKYSKEEHRIQTQEGFELFLEDLAKREDQMAVLAGYRMLNQAERSLFIRALGSRWVLDVSKEHIMANRFGMMERDYADPAGRDALCDEFFENSMSAMGGVLLADDAYEDAFKGMLSAQVNDAADYTKLQNSDLSSMLSSGEQWFGPSRTTAVDWKLVMRALQLVHRCSNESKIYAGDKELYVSQGDLSKSGQFEFQGKFMRRNLHSAGNRLSRYFGRRVADNLKDQIPGPLIMILRGCVPIGINNALSQYAVFEEEEKKGVVANIADKLDTVDGLLNDTINENAKKYGIFSDGFQETMENLGEQISTVSTVVGYISDALDIVEAFSNKYKLSKSEEQAAQAEEQDEARMKEAATHQTQQQEQLSREAKERNARLQQQGRTKASERQTDAIVESVGSIISRTLGNKFEKKADVIEIAVTEAGKFINMVRSYFNDKDSVREYFEKSGEIAQLKAVMEKETPGAFDDENSLELIRQARGYENYTEMASFVGLNVTRSLLFCASRFNTQESLRIVALATLGVLGMEDVIGKIDNQSAERVYDAIMGGEYR